MKFSVVLTALVLLNISHLSEGDVILDIAKYAIKAISVGLKVNDGLESFFGEDPNAETKRGFENIIEKLDSFQSQIEHGQVTALADSNVKRIIELQSKINSAIDAFKRVCMQLGPYDDISDRMDNFINNYDKNYDFEILDMQEKYFPTIESIPKHYANYAKSLNNMYTNTVNYSPASLLYGFHVSTIYHALKYIYVLELATMARDILRYQHFNGHAWDDRREQRLRKYRNLIERNSNLVNDQKSLSHFLRLPTDLRGNDTSFKKVFQTYWENEKVLTNGCTSNCVFDVKSWNDDNCKGKIGQCFYNDKFGMDLRPGSAGGPLPVGTTGHANYEKYNIASDEMRIYTSYTLSGKPQGIGGPSIKQIYLNSYLEWFHHCDVCQCICDQSDTPFTERKIYGGVMNAPDGYVITGVRFAKKLEVLYLDIQYGKILFDGIIDPSTLTWSESPRDILHNTFNIGFDLQKFALDDVYFNDGHFLTGIQLFPHANMIRTKIFGTKGQSVKEHSLRNTNHAVIQVRGKMYRLNLNDQRLVVTRSDEGSKSVQFSTSEELADAGQTTVPFFDTNEVVQDFPLALSGIGYVHYANDGYAGYIKPVIKSVDFKLFI